MVAITYEVKLDTGRNNTFAGTYDDITAYVINNIEWGSGFTRGQDSYSAISEPVAPPAQMSLQLDNRTKVFNPETLGSELVTNGDFSGWAGSTPNSWTKAGTGGASPSLVTQTGINNTAFVGSGTGSANLFTTGGIYGVSLSQTILTVGKTYRVQLTLGAVGSPVSSGGGVGVYSGTTVHGLCSSVGTYTFYFVATATTFKIANYPDACDITIDDVTVKEVSRYGGLLVPGTLVRLRATYGSTQQMFIGKITYGGVRYGSNFKSAAIEDQSVMVTIQDAMNDLGDIEYITPLQTDVTTDQVISKLFESAVIPWPYFSTTWMIGVAGASELNYTTYLLPAQNTSFETGKTTFTFAGDAADNGRGVQAQQYIRDVMMAEAGGRFYYQPRTGTWIFHNRHHDTLNDTVSATLASTVFEKMDYRFGDDLVNNLTLNYTRKSIGSPATIIWSSTSDPIKVDAQSTRKIKGNYLAGTTSTKRVGAYQFLPMSGYVVATNVEGSIAATGGYTVNSVPSATSVATTIENKNAFPIFVFGLLQYGTPLVWYDETVSNRLPDSVRKYDEHNKQPLNIKMIDDPNFANDVTLYILSRYGEPQARFDNVTFLANQNATNAGHMINRTIGDRITITHSDLNHNSDYTILGERHSFNAQSKDHYVTWYLKPTFRETFWILDKTGRAELGVNTRLGL